MSWPGGRVADCVKLEQERDSRGSRVRSVTDSRLASLVITHTDNAHNTLTLPSLLSVTTVRLD